jgi:hypothetical protein
MLLITFLIQLEVKGDGVELSKNFKLSWKNGGKIVSKIAR